MNKATLEQIAANTGTSIKECRDLIEAGWTYKESVLCAPGWVDPQE